MLTTQPAKAEDALACEPLPQAEFNLFVGFVHWVVEVLDEESGSWLRGKASQYLANTNEIYIGEFGNGLEGCVELDFSFIRLVSSEDLEPRSKRVFEFLSVRQRAMAPAAPAAAAAEDAEEE